MRSPFRTRPRPGLGPGSRRSFRAPHALAQAPATITASRSAEISAFAEFTTVSAGYCSPCRAKGIVFGADYTHFSRRLLNPALEVCGSVASGSPYTENSLALGLHLGPELGRLHHYADLLAGVGSIHYNPPIVYPDGTVYSYDNSAVFQVGGGLQDDVRSNWAIQAEVEAQRWNLGSTTPSSSIPRHQSRPRLPHPLPPPPGPVTPSTRARCRRPRLLRTQPTLVHSRIEQFS